METLDVPRVLVSGAASGAGKTILALGLMHELRRAGKSVSCCLLGSPLAQAVVFRRLSGRYVRALDSRLLSKTQILAALRQASSGADIVLVVGERGLFDGAAGTLHGSDAEFAFETKTPVVLVVDSEHFGASVSALVRGYVDSAAGFTIDGWILNRVPPAACQEEDAVYEKAFEARNLAAPMGIVPLSEEPLPVPPGPVSEERNVTSLPRQFYMDAAKLVSDHIDVEQVIRAAERAERIALPEYHASTYPRRVRIAVSDDGCFSLCVQDNLDLLRHFGAELVPFSPLADSALPKRIGGLYLTGAFLGEYGRELEANESMKASITEFVRAGGLIYSEGGGTAFLCERIDMGEGSVIEGVGVLPAEAEFRAAATNAPIEFESIEETILGPAGTKFKGMSTGEWNLKERERILKTATFPGAEGRTLEGYSPSAQSFCTFCFAHLGSAPELAKRIVDAAEVFQKI